MKRPAAFIGGMAVIAVVFAINRYAAHHDPTPDARVLEQAADQRQHPAAPAGAVGDPPLRPGIHHIPIDQQDLPRELADQLRAELKNLRETGSTSAGRQTHEFKHVDDLARRLMEQGLDGLVAQLAITPSALASLLGPPFRWVGADVQGKDVAKLGRVGFFQVFQAPSTDQWVELSERQYDVLGGDGAVISPEFFNGSVLQHPAIIETLDSSDGAVLHNLKWMVGDRAFFLTTRNMPKPEALRLAGELSLQFAQMPHGGWRVPYEFDPENPVHRITRARLQSGAPSSPVAR